MSTRGSCDVCGRETTLLQRTVGRFCQKCAKSLPLTQCIDCGAKLRLPVSVAQPRCARCIRIGIYDGQPCQRCGRIPERHRRRFINGQVACASCANHFKPHTECFYCKRIGTRRHRDYVIGLMEPACGACRKRQSHIPNCAGCHRPRYPAGERDGKLYCEACLATGSPPIIRCRQCHQRRSAYGKYICEDCSWERSHQKLMAMLMPSFQTVWARELFAGYHREAQLRSKRGNWQKNLKRDVTFFIAIEQHFDRAEDLSAVLIVRRLGYDKVRPYRRAMSFLAHAGWIVLDADPDYLVEQMADRLRRMASRSSAWIEALLIAYIDHLMHQRKLAPDRRRHNHVPTKPESLSACVRLAKKLLDYGEREFAVHQIRDIDQNILDRFLGDHRSYRLGISSFVRYTNAHGRLFRKLKLPKPPHISIPANLFLAEETRLEKIQALATVTDPNDTRWALIGLFNLVYAQMAHRSCAMRLDQVRDSEAGYQVKFASCWLELDEIMVPLMRRWLGQRREISAFETGSNPYLFPGQATGTHIHSTCGHYFRKRHGLGGRQARATALAALIRNGLSQARVLTDCLGISPTRAHQYCIALGARDYEVAKFARETYVD